jgi:hypothetical protein
MPLASCRHKRFDSAGCDERLSFMEKCGLCFKLRRGPEAWRLEDVFVSFEHLPMSKELQLQKIVFRKSRRAVILETEASAH